MGGWIFMLCMVLLIPLTMIIWGKRVINYEAKDKLDMSKFRRKINYSLEDSKDECAFSYPNNIWKDNYIKINCVYSDNWYGVVERIQEYGELIITFN